MATRTFKEPKTLVVAVKMSFIPHLGFDEGEKMPGKEEMKLILAEHLIDWINNTLEGNVKLIAENVIDSYKIIEEINE